MSSFLVPRSLQDTCQLILVLSFGIVQTTRPGPDSYGTDFVTLFPFVKEMAQLSTFTFDIINPNENETATIHLSYLTPSNETIALRLQQDTITVAPTTHATVSFATYLVHKKPHFLFIITFCFLYLFLLYSYSISVTSIYYYVLFV
ncbi:unnamed protein product [Gongylonema pulchrum]|uniref:Translocon-associated protein subunit alpha n=1 Tax=Gongylonema pulchrum TaxID=637853 RepID=A0A183DEX2_9BILA|nr:unnamed protein product [Gongylonema pulchrum]